jgi:branched-subunit amino acid aminotransferase/4-amino-4-deoxychorismate lyase
LLQKFDERNRDLIVNVGGRLSHRDEAGVSPFDSVVQGGDAVWEGLRLTGGRIFALEEHLARLRRSAHALGFAAVPADESLIAEIRRTLAANSMHSGVHVRLTLTRGVKVTSGMDPRLNVAGPTLIVLAEFKDPVYDQSGIRLITSSVRRHAPDSLDPKIHHNNLLTSILAKIEANVAGADDAVMLDSRGFLAETNATHLFLVFPRDAHGAVDGTGLPGRDHPGDRAAAGLVFGNRLRRGRLHAPAALQRVRGLRHRDDGRPRSGDLRGRPFHRRRIDRPGHQAPHRALREPHRHHRHRGRVTSGAVQCLPNRMVVAPGRL